jgi:hypothetical protein
MYHLVFVSFPLKGPSHLLGSFLRHEKPLEPRQEWKITEDLLGNPSLPLRAITRFDLKVSRGFAMDAIAVISMFFSK